MNKLHKNIGLALFVVAAPLIRLVISRTTRTRVAIIADGNVLLIKNWLGKNQWSLPGGGVRAREDAAGAACRELSEELNLSVKPQQLKAISNKPFNYIDHGKSFRFYGFVLLVPAAAVYKRRKTEITESKWVSLEQTFELSLSLEANLLLTALKDRPNLLK